MHFKTKKYNELNVEELYSILKLRQEVFIVEQNCPYLDTDDKDQLSYHLMGYNKNEQLIAYSRLLPPGVSYKHYCSIGRVVNAKTKRGQGIGKILMKESIKKIKIIFPKTSIKISAQIYLQSFYEGLGFRISGASYLEDNIPHIAMIYSND